MFNRPSKGAVVRSGVMQGKFNPRKHDHDAEFLTEGFVLSRGHEHRPRAPQRAAILMVENAGFIKFLLLRLPIFAVIGVGWAATRTCLVALGALNSSNGFV